MARARSPGRIPGLTAVTAIVCVAWSSYLAFHSSGPNTQAVSNVGLMAVALAAGGRALMRGR
ncbi:MAG TPA: hypothetical protein VIQ02_11180, partial [Jiangellaceae bacterium]